MNVKSRTYTLRPAPAILGKTIGREACNTYGYGFRRRAPRGQHHPQRPPAAMAAAGILRLCPLWHEYLYRAGMGRRRRRPRPLPPHRPGPGPVGPGGGRRGHAGADFDLQAPRRFLPVAQPVYRLHGGRQPLEKRPGRCGAGDRRRLPPGRAEIRGLPLPLGPARAQLRQRRSLQSVLSGPAHRAAHRLRGALLRLAGRRLRRRAAGQGPAVRLGCLVPGGAPVSARGGTQRQRAGRALVRQRSGPYPPGRVERGARGAAGPRLHRRPQPAG